MHVTVASPIKFTLVAINTDECHQSSRTDYTKGQIKIHSLHAFFSKKLMPRTEKKNLSEGQLKDRLENK